MKHDATQFCSLKQVLAGSKVPSISIEIDNFKHDGKWLIKHTFGSLKQCQQKSIRDVTIPLLKAKEEQARKKPAGERKKTAKRRTKNSSKIGGSN